MDGIEVNIIEMMKTECQKSNIKNTPISLSSDREKLNPNSNSIFSPLSMISDIKKEVLISKIQDSFKSEYDGI